MPRFMRISFPDRGALWFAARCTLAVTAACWLSDTVGLQHTVWAAMSALIVSQENLAATRSQVLGRIMGTIIGALIAVLVHRGADYLAWPVSIQVALAVAIAAFVARERPALRVCLWTCPLVLLTTAPQISPELTAASRTIEVLLGAVIGGLLHIAEARLRSRLHVADKTEPGQDSGSD